MSEPNGGPAASTWTGERHARRIAGAAGIMMAAILASRLLGVVRNAVISHRLGQKFEADVYYAAFQLPDLLFYLVAGGALSSAFIPVFTEHLATGREREAWRIFSTVACVMFVLVGAFVVVGWVFAPLLMQLVVPGASAEKIAQTVPLTRILLPAQLCFFLGGLLMGAQQAHQRFLIPALGPVIYNVGIIVGGIALVPWLGTAGLVWGALGGALVGNFLLQAWAVRRLGAIFTVSFHARDPAVMKVWRLMLPVVLGVALPQVSIWVNRAFASALGDGPLAALTNANQLMQVPLGVFAQAMAVAIFPTLSAQAARGELTHLRETASAGIRSLLFLTVPASLWMLLLARPTVALLLQHGKFGPDDTRLTATALAYYCLGIFAWSAQSILSRAFYALQDTRTPVVIGTAVTILFVPLNWLLMSPAGLGIRGLALATSIAATLNCLVMLWVLARRLQGFEGKRLARSLAQIGMAAALSGLACAAAAGVARQLVGGGLVKAEAAAELALGTGAALAIYLVLARAMGSEELSQMLGLLRRRKAARAA